jgi:arylsulfatase A-like enzyme
MKRRLVSRVALAVLLAGSLECSGAEPPRLILLLTSDTLRADRLGIHGNTLDLTPNLDVLLRESETFRFAFAPSAYTLPSVGALMTGRHPEELGVHTNLSRIGGPYATLASVLQLNGWRTGAVVSNFVLRRSAGFAEGFEIYDDNLSERESRRAVPERTARGTTTAALSVLDALLGAPRSPLFLWVHYQDPHGPYLPPGARRDRYLAFEREVADGRLELPVGGSGLPEGGFGSIPSYQYIEGQHEVAFYRAGYDGEVAYLDEEIGRLFDGMRERGVYEESVIVFTADHGEGLGENDYWFAHGEYLSDELVRVPLAIRAPRRSPATRSDPATLVDVLPTVLGLAGISVAGGYPGRDLLGDGAREERPEIYLAALRHATVPRFGLVADGFKYLRSGEEVTTEQLFRLEDPERDLSGEEVERVAVMRSRLDALRHQLRIPGELRQQLTSTESERLRQLGYVVE